MRRSDPDHRRHAAEGRAAARVAAELVGIAPPGPLGASPPAHATAVVEAALATLDILGDQGWQALVGQPPGVRTRIAGAPSAVTPSRSGPSCSIRSGRA